MFAARSCSKPYCIMRTVGVAISCTFTAFDLFVQTLSVVRYNVCVPSTLKPIPLQNACIILCDPPYLCSTRSSGSISSSLSVTFAARSCSLIMIE
jgi:hypothetical protein